MSGTTIHKQARTTPQLREEIRHWTLSERALAAKYNVTRSTVREWRHRDTASDRSHRPRRLRTALTSARGPLWSSYAARSCSPSTICWWWSGNSSNRHLVARRRSDCSRAIASPMSTHWCRNPRVGRSRRASCATGPGACTSTLSTCRPWLASRGALTSSWPSIVRAAGPASGGTRSNRRGARSFLLTRLREKAPLHMHTLLTDNDPVFIDRFTLESRQPSGHDVFDWFCTDFGTEHRWCMPRRCLQINGVVERFNGSIAEISRTYALRCSRRPGFDALALQPVVQ